MDEIDDRLQPYEVNCCMRRDEGYVFLAIARFAMSVAFLLPMQMVSRFVGD